MKNNQRRFIGWVWGISLFLWVGVSGCTYHYPVNPFLKEYNPAGGYRLQDTRKADRADPLLLFLTFSGGGTRAAALAYGVLEELAQTEILMEGRKRTLLDEVDIISGVSGGSFPAAYYGLFGHRIFKDFENEFLKKDIQTGLFIQAAEYENWPRLWSGHFGRSDLSAEYYHRNIFEGGTFGDMAARGGPMIFINATDITSGAIFTFTQESFDFICSDISRFPIGRAVAASSAVPVLLSPITLYNFAGSCDSKEPEWVKRALEYPQLSKRQFHRAVHLRSYQDAKNKPFIHLMDGGLSDNLGLRAVIDQLTHPGSLWENLQSIGWDKARKIVFVVVNAEKEAEADADRRERTLTSPTVMKSVARIPIALYNLETVDLLRQYFPQWEREIRSQRCRSSFTAVPETQSVPRPDPCGDIQFYMIEVDFEALPDEKEQNYLQLLPTSFNLAPEAVDRLREAGRRILKNSPEFQRLIKDLRLEKGSGGD